MAKKKKYVTRDCDGLDAICFWETTEKPILGNYNCWALKDDKEIFNKDFFEVSNELARIIIGRIPRKGTVKEWRKK